MKIQSNSQKSMRVFYYFATTDIQKQHTVKLSKKFYIISMFNNNEYYWGKYKTTGQPQ